MRIPLPRRITVLRIACVAALAASAALTADSWHSDRGFCPLKSACEKARASAFGSVLGVPTSGIGLLAFSGLFLLTLLPPARARKLARPAALVGAAAGTGLALVQALSLHIFCPLCVVADVSALVAGAAVVGWRVPKPRKGRKKPPVPEFVGSRLRWALAAILAVVVPLGWPRETKPAWVEIASPMDLASTDPDEVSAPAAGIRRPAKAPAKDAPSQDRRAELPPPPSDRPAPERHGALPDDAIIDPRPGSPAVAEDRAPTPTEPQRIPGAATAPGILLVEYLNPFCSHCRATHARLDRLLASMDVVVRRRRVYVWAQDEPPLWARTLSCAREAGYEDRYFEELVRSSGQDAASIEAAAARAGIDPASLSMCRASAATLARLQRERDTVIAAGIESLPTFDIGRRRLLGEQSEAELREALDAAIANPATH